MSNITTVNNLVCSGNQTISGNIISNGNLQTNNITSSSISNSGTITSNIINGTTSNITNLNLSSLLKLAKMNGLCGSGCLNINLIANCTPKIGFILLSNPVVARPGARCLRPRIRSTWYAGSSGRARSCSWSRRAPRSIAQSSSAHAQPGSARVMYGAAKMRFR